jgi:KDO2-lipid IV(A) lauroyltransferase
VSAGVNSGGTYTFGRRVKTWIEYVGFMAVRSLALMLSYERARSIGGALGGAVYKWTGIRKRVTLENLRLAFPGKSDEELDGIALGAFRNYGQSILLMLWYPSASEDEIRRIVRFKNPTTAEAARGRGKGVIVLSAHFGPWELMIPGVNIAMGWPLLAIVQRQRNYRINDLVDRGRKMHGTTTVPMNLAVREVLTTLREGKAVLILGDQSGSKESLFVPFFGRPAATHRGTASFALKTGAPIVMMLLYHSPDGLVEVEFEEVPTSDLPPRPEDQIFELTRRHVAMLEEKIRNHPDHWLWMHKRWKHSPPKEADGPAANDSGRNDR